MEKTHLVIIDPQNDFCDPQGSLYVKGAETDMVRLAAFIDKHTDKIQNISVTLDSHHIFDIAHPAFWVDSAGKHPAPLATMISHDDVKKNVWMPKRSGMIKHCLDYTQKLEANNRYPLMIWPPHCIIGSWGNNVYPVLLDALNRWAINHCSTISYVTKGSNVYTEHYSAIKADVPMPNDPSTNLNTQFIQSIERADNILVAGEASSHCVMYTVKDIVNEFDAASLSKMILLTDAMSPVQAPGIDFPKMAQDFITDMQSKGLRTDTTVGWMSSKTLGAK